MVNLPASDWTQRKGLAALVAALGVDNVRWVGGAVRDTLLGVEVADVDAATPLTPDAVIDHCREAGIRYSVLCPRSGAASLHHALITAAKSAL